MRELVAAIARLSERPERLVSYEPDRYVEENFGSLPELRTPLADWLGFRSDGDLESLVEHVFDDFPTLVDPVATLPLSDDG